MYHGEDIVLTAYGCNGYVQWKDPEGNIISVVNDPSNTFRGPGVYQARCVSFLDEVSGWVSIEIGVKTTPAHIAYADKSHANPTETVILTVEGCEPYFYNWEINGISKFGATQTVTGPGTYHVRCIYNDNTPYGDYVDVTVLTKPINTPNVSADKTVAYEIETVNLAASGCEPYFYNWSINGQSLFGANQVVSGPGTYSVRCILNDNSPYGEYVSITVVPKVINKPVAQADRGKAYEAETVNLTASGCEPYYYQWSINGESKFGATQTATGPGAYSVRCYYSDNLSASEFVAVNVALKPLNTPTAFASQPASAVGETVNLSATGCESSGYRWLINQDGNVTYVSSSSTTVANPGTYYVSCYSGNQVGTVSEITIKPKPPGAVNIEASKTHGCSDEPIALKGSGCPNGKIVWRKDLSTFLGNENPTLTMGNMRKNRSWNNNALTINGQAYSSGLGVLAKTEVTYNLAQQFSSFSAIVGIDDEEKGNCGSPETVTYKVYGDGTLLLSRTVTQNDGGVQITVDVSGKNLLKLVVEPEPGKDWCSHADWANAKLSPVSGADEIQSGNQVDFFGSGTYEAYCVTGGISGPKSSIDILPCDANLPRIITSKTRVFPNETFTLNASGNHYYVRSIQSSANQVFWGHQVPATITGEAKLEAPWSGGPTIKAEVFEQESDGLRLLATKYKARDGEQALILALGCSFGRVEWKIGNNPPSYGHVKAVYGPGFYRARCVPDENGNAELFNNSDWTLLTIHPNGIVQPIVDAPLTMCTGVSTALTASGCPAGYQYQWKTVEKVWNNFSSSINITNPQEVEARCLKNDYSFWYPSTKVNIYPTFPADFKAQANGPLLVGSNLRLAATYMPNTLYRWTGPNGYNSGTPTAANRIITLPTVTDAATGEYTLTATSGGCTTTATTEVKVIGCDFKIKAVDPITNEERYTLYPDTVNAGHFKPLALLVEAPVGLPLNNYDFEWSNTAGATVTDIHAQSIAATSGGVYKVRISPFDNASVGCVASVSITEYEADEILYGLTREVVMSNGISANMTPILNSSNTVRWVTTIENGIESPPRRYSVSPTMNYLFQYEFLGTHNEDLISIIPTNQYVLSHTTLNPYDFTGKVIFSDRATGIFRGGWEYENGSYIGKVKVIEANSIRSDDCATIFVVRTESSDTGNSGMVNGQIGIPDRTNPNTQPEQPCLPNSTQPCPPNYHQIGSSLGGVSVCRCVLVAKSEDIDKPQYEYKTTIFRHPCQGSDETGTTEGDPDWVGKYGGPSGPKMTNSELFQPNPYFPIDKSFPELLCQTIQQQVASNSSKLNVENCEQFKLMAKQLLDDYKENVAPSRVANNIVMPSDAILESAFVDFKRYIEDKIDPTSAAGIFLRDASCAITSASTDPMLTPAEIDEFQSALIDYLINQPTKYKNEKIPVFKALASLIAVQKCQNSADGACSSGDNIAEKVYQGMTDAGLNPEEDVLYFNGGAYMEESTIIDLFNEMGGSYDPNADE